ncbi:MAG: 3-phosphoshikimate 1-carboxyvinyltransferase [Alphaproteobacteria bacterium]|nr:3-phosphoshikimate 1-carboxyvinyltransferase [Alphaproteobacteria bacterium]
MHGVRAVKPLVSRTAGALKGEARVPGDKSISHRALMTGALAIGESRIEGLLEGDDVLRTAAALRAFGARIERKAPGAWSVAGLGVGGLGEPDQVLDMGNSGTGARLLMGLVATHDFTAHFTGDASLVKRPMARVTAPLERMGANFLARSGGRLPLAVIGTGEPVPISYRLPVPSAQVKSAILYAALNTPGETTVIEPQPTRDHTELMLRHFGAELRIETHADGARAVTLVGQPELTARDLRVPADISSAAFPLVAALLTPDSEITLPEVGINPLRAGLIESLREMGADLRLTNERTVAGERVADLVVRGGTLNGIEVPAERAPRMIDEYPILAVAAACARGTTRLRGLAELRVKESDRLSAIARGLAACGVKVAVEGDDLTIEGTGAPPKGGARVESELDHRIAMSFLVLGMVAKEPVSVDDGEPIETSFPTFESLMNRLGARIEAA